MAPPPPQLPSQMMATAAQVSIVHKRVEEWRTQEVSEGRSAGKVRYFYAGNGSDRNEIEEDVFLGRSDDFPRLPGFYLVDVVSDDESRTICPMPWVAIYQTQPKPAEMRDASADGQWQGLAEEHRIERNYLRNELTRERKQAEDLRKDFDLNLKASDNLRKKLVTVENERQAAVQHAAEMEALLERERNLRLEIEAEAASFQPQIQQAVDHLADRAGPALMNILPQFAEYLGDGPSAAYRAGTSASGSAANGSGKPAATAPGSEAPPSPQDTAEGLFALWENEPLGRFLVEVQQVVAWSTIRGVVFHVRGIDLGPTPKWPSDVQREAEAEEAKASGQPPIVTPAPGTPEQPQEGSGA